MKQNHKSFRSIDLIKRLLFFGFLLTFSINFAQNETTLTLLNSYDIDDVGEPSGLAYDSINNQLFAVSDSDDIFRLSIAGDVLDSYNFSADLEGVTVYDTNTLLVAIEDTYELVEYNYITGNTTSHTMDYENQDDPGSGIEGVTFNPTNGEIYFLNEKDPAALIVANSNFNVTDEYELTFSGDLSASSYDDETGFLWLGSDEESTIYKCDIEGNVIETFPLEDDDDDELDKIEGIAIDNENQLLYIVTDGDAQLYVYSISEEEGENEVEEEEEEENEVVEEEDTDCVAEVPSNRNSSNVSETEATLNWSFDTEIDHYNVRYRPTNSSDWITLTSLRESEDDIEVSRSTASILISGLNSDITYEWQIRAKCSDGSASSYFDGTGEDFRTSDVDNEEDNSVVSASICTAGTNLSLNSTVVDFSDQQNTTNSADNINDGDDDNRWSAFGFSQDVTLDLGEEYNVDEINLLTFEDRDYQFIVEGSTSSATSGFSTLVDATDNTDEGPINRTFSSQTVRYVRLTVTGANDYSGPWVSIHDFEVICAGSTGNKNALATVTNDAFNISAYPNPFTSIINVQANDTNLVIGNVQLVNLSGKVITNQSSINGVKTSLDNVGVTNGIYLLQIFNTENQLIKVVKLIKE